MAIDPRALQRLRDNDPRLTDLKFWVDGFVNQIGDAGVHDLAEALKSNRTLTSLNLRNNQITNAGAHDLAEALKSNRTLTNLYLFNNQITDDGAHDLAEALKSNRTLTVLDLGKNQITDAGAHDLAEALKSNNTLTYLSLGDNHIGDDGAQALAEAGFELDGNVYKRVTAAQETPVAVGKYTAGETNRNDAREKQRRAALENGEGI